VLPKPKIVIIMAAKEKIPFNSLRHESREGGRFEVNTKKSSNIVISTPVVPPWVDDGSWTEYKSNGSISDTKKSSVVTSPMRSQNQAFSPGEARVILKPVVFPYISREDSIPKNIPTSAIVEASIQYNSKKKNSLPISITSGLIHNLSISTMGTSFMEVCRSPVKSCGPPVKYTTFQFNNGGVESNSSLVNVEVKAEVGPVGEFYLPKKLSKSITLPTISRADLKSAERRLVSSKNLPTSGDGFNDELEDDAGDRADEHSEMADSIPVASDGSPMTSIPPVQPVPYQVHNRVLGSKFLLPVSSSRKILSPPRSGNRAMSESAINHVSGSEDGIVPFQVHKRIMGWKLTSMQRRKELISLLDIVNSRDDNGQRLKRELERQGVLANLPVDNSGKIQSISETVSAEDALQKKRTTKRMAASWERAVSRVIKARVGILDGKAEFQKHKENRDHLREQRRKQLQESQANDSTTLSQEKLSIADSTSFLFDDYEPDRNNFSDYPDINRSGSNQHSIGRQFSPLVHGDSNVVRTPNIRFSTEQQGFSENPASPPSVRTNTVWLNAHIRALSPPLKVPVETYTSTTDLLIFNDRMVSF
jgi:hypothetical protein